MNAIYGIGQAGQAPKSADKLNRQAMDLEGVFLNTLMKEMFSGIDTEGPFGGGFGEETWRSMQSEQLANAMAEAGGIGLAEQLTRDLLAMQEAAQANQTPIFKGAY